MALLSLVEPSLEERDITEVVVTGGVQRGWALMAEGTTEIAEKLSGLGGPVLTEKESTELDYQEGLASLVGALTSLQSVAYRRFCFLIPSRLEIHLGLDPRKCQESTGLSGS